MIINNAIVFD